MTGPIPSETRGSGGGLTVRELANRYLDERELERRGGVLSEKRLLLAHYHLGDFVTHFGDREAEYIRPSDVRRWILSHEDWKSPHTRLNAARDIKAMWNWANGEDLIVKNRVAFMKSCWPTPQPRQPITPEEYQKIMLDARRSNGQGRRMKPGRTALRVGLYFLWNSGARTCECFATRWQDVDFEKAVVKLVAHKTAASSGAPRFIRLNQPLVRLLRFIYLRRTAILGRPPQPEESVFLTSRGTPWDKDSFARLFRRFADQAGIRKEVTAYTLRHGFTCVALEAGVGERQLADLLGQSSTKYISWYGRGTRRNLDYLHASGETIDAFRRGMDGAK